MSRTDLRHWQATNKLAKICYSDDSQRQIEKKRGREKYRERGRERKRGQSRRKSCESEKAKTPEVRGKKVTKLNSKLINWLIHLTVNGFVLARTKFLAQKQVIQPQCTV